MPTIDPMFHLEFCMIESFPAVHLTWTMSLALGDSMDLFLDQFIQLLRAKFPTYLLNGRISLSKLWLIRRVVLLVIYQVASRITQEVGKLLLR